MVLHSKQGEAVAVYSEESEEYHRVEQVLEILFEADKRTLAKLSERQEQQQQKIESQVEECDKKVIRKAVKRSRKRYNLTQIAKILGVHPTYISGIERGVRNMTLKNIEKLANALGVSVNELLK